MPGSFLAGLKKALTSSPANNGMVEVEDHGQAYLDMKQSFRENITKPNARIDQAVVEMLNFWPLGVSWINPDPTGARYIAGAPFKKGSVKRDWKQKESFEDTRSVVESPAAHLRTELLAKALNFYPSYQKEQEAQHKFKQSPWL